MRLADVRTAYFTMEIALEPGIPTYSGGLGVLAGDTIRSCADLGLNVIAVSLLHRQGFFRQTLSETGEQSESPDPWKPESRLERVPGTIVLNVRDRRIHVCAWRYDVEGCTGAVVPVYLLDTDLPDNDPDDRRLTDDLYLGDDRHRLRQEVVLGLGGIALLEAIGDDPRDCYHLNEGHAALAVLALLERSLTGVGSDKASAISEALEIVRSECVFTTHTPVPAGHDKFDWDLVGTVLGQEELSLLDAIGIKGELNMTELALAGAKFVNGVAVRHGEVSRSMFPGYPIRSITNGVHGGTWTAPSMQSVFDRHVPEWRIDPSYLRYASQIPVEEIEGAHRVSKAALLKAVREATGRRLDPEALTLAFARRATGYKRADLLFRDLERLQLVAERHGALQLVFAGKAHPHDGEGKGLIQRVFEASRKLAGKIEVVYVPGYDMKLGLLLTSGSDIWLNNPIPPLEASGTSGMKAALNGVPSLSICDGWWVEGCIEGVTGWAIEDGWVQVGEDPHSRDAYHADALYRKLDSVVMPLYYERPDAFLEIRRHAISLNGSFFNTHRMVMQYVREAYLA